MSSLNRSLRAAFVLLTSLISLNVVDAASPTEAQFTKLFADSLSQRLGGQRVKVVKDLQIEVDKNDGTWSFINLENAYFQYQSDSTAMVRHLAAHAAVLGGITDLELRLESLVPVIRNCNMLDQMPSDKRSRLFYERLNEELCIFYVNNDSLSMTYLSESKVLPYDSLFDIRTLGVCNLQQALPEILRYDVKTGYMLTAGGSFETSLLLLDYIWNHETLPVDGDYVVAVPNRDILLVSGSRDSVSLGIIRAEADTMFHQFKYPVSQELFIRNSGRWEVYRGSRQ